MRTAALVLAALLALPAAAALLWRRPEGGRPAVPRPPLDALWAVVPIALLLALIGLSAFA